MSYPMSTDDAARFQRGKQVEQIKLEREILVTLKEINESLKALSDNLSRLVDPLPRRTD